MATSLKVSLCVLLATAVLAASPEAVEGSPLGGLVAAPDTDSRGQTTVSPSIIVNPPCRCPPKTTGRQRIPVVVYRSGTRQKSKGLSLEPRRTCEAQGAAFLWGKQDNSQTRLS
nr:uncharacterized protein LOC113828086 [Penaeus vannamei]